MTIVSARALYNSALRISSRNNVFKSANNLHGAARKMSIESFRFGCPNPQNPPEKSTVIFILGAPGSGKGTQCSLLSQRLNYMHLSAGDLIRKERDTPGSQFGAQIAEAIREPGTFVPAEITVELLCRAISGAGKRELLIDGFPINWDNFRAWDRQMGGATQVECVLFLEVCQRTSIQRCLGRGRSDDTELVLGKRFEAYMSETKPVVEFYRGKGLLKPVDAERDKDEVFRSILQALGKADNDKRGTSANSV